ncbi:LLM class flavin-dependent oxidoreductase [Nocardia sp. NPDC056064]|uniref:LLM class flavin-dependent oxidoreductase n=1 Tax=Nocardia sp. NPDC056064 TaxID=3345701 RepID=UPI0035DA76CB
MDLALRPGPAPDLTLRVTLATAKLGGADSVFVPDHLIGLLPPSIWQPDDIGAARLLPGINAHYEPWTVLGYLAAKNTRLRWGIGVTDAARRHPAVTAQAAATLHQLSRGKAILGLGPGERENNEPFGIDWTRPVARFEEAMATIRALWDSNGAPISRDSAYFPLRDAVFEIPPYRDTRPGIWVGAHGPRMLRAVGRYADGWFPAYPQPVQDYRRRLDRIRNEAADAGRDPLSIVPAALLFVITGHSDADVENAVDSLGARAFGLCMSADLWRRHGLEHPLGPGFSGIQDLLPQTLDRATVLSGVEQIPVSMIREYCVTGTPTQIQDQLAEWRDGGLEYPVLVNVSSFRPDVTRGLSSGVPFIRALRKIRRL